MDGWYQSSRPRYSPAARGIPVRKSPPKSDRPSSTKIISIPVHFVGSETKSALKIQKVLRGYLVRKNIKRILGIKGEVEEIERRLLGKHTIELIRKDAKERLRINETLMALLFKLDSIRGVYAEIRECRKAVIKKAVGLQEKVDRIVELDDSDSSSNSNSNSNSSLEKKENELEDVIGEVGNCNLGSGEALSDLNCNDADQDLQTESAKCEDNPGQTEEEESVTVLKEVPSWIEKEEEEEERRKNDEIVERMRAENEKLMKVVRQLCERNEMQTHLLTSLMHRVECLEKALVCNKLRTKKKKPNYSA